MRDARSRLREVHRAIAPGVRERVDRLAHCRPAAHHVVNRTAGCHVPWRPDAAREQPPPPGRTPRLGQGWPGGASPRVVRGAPRPFATSSVTLGPDRRFRSLRHIDRWEVRMPGCVGEWDHHRYGRSSRRSSPCNCGGPASHARHTPQRINETAFRRVSVDFGCAAPGLGRRGVEGPFSPPLAVSSPPAPRQGGSGRLASIWARNSPKVRAGRDRDARARALRPPQRPGHRCRSSSVRGRNPPGPTSPGVRGPGEAQALARRAPAGARPQATPDHPPAESIT